MLARGRFARVRLSSVSSRRAGRGAGRIRPLFPVVAICPVLVSLSSLSEAWLMSSESCFDELPPRASSYLLAIIARLVLRLVSLVSEGISLCLSCLRCVFLVFFFSSFAGVLCLLDLSPYSSRPVVSSSRLVLRLGRRRFGLPCAACLICSRWCSRLAPSSRRAGRGTGRDGEIS